MIERDDVLYVDIAPIFSESISGFNYSVPNLASGRVAAGARSVLISSYAEKARPLMSVKNVIKFAFIFIHVLVSERGKSKVIFVFHCTWVPLHWLAALILTTLNRPYLHTPRGDLSAEALKRSPRRKKVAYKLFVRRFLRASRGVNFLSPGERDSCALMADCEYSFICPNGVDTEILNQFGRSIELSLSKDGVDFAVSERSHAKIGFLGRCDVAIKGVDRFIEWTSEYSASRDFDVRALLAGPPSEELDRYLGQRKLNGFRDEGLNLKGPYYGPDKYDFLRSLDVLVIPSRSEGVPAVFFEALSCVPLIIISSDISDNLSEFSFDDGFVSFVNGYDDFEARLDSFFVPYKLQSQDLRALLDRRRKHLQRFDWTSIGVRYREMAERGTPSL